ncbi:MAG: hypothetical protein COW30_18105 [Rhodospirillales bacterium CG15_BIG_FIL_POST_REV_8_21_14_020_66_15]|nr:MAG: hypothetical protein COW30_18105 [Rhodospirillales bacterium CG15_BIG_FIL_POST_REV_8_21_14_020_66_15]
MSDHKLKEWEKRFDYATHSDLLAANIGVFVLKTVIILNAGALVTLIAAYPHLRNETGFVARLPEAGTLFFWGLAAAIVAGFLGYIYQSLVTRNEWDQMAVRFPAPNTKPPKQWAKPTSTILIIIILLLGVFAIGVFLKGASHMLDAFKIDKSQIEQTTKSKAAEANKQ